MLKEASKLFFQKVKVWLLIFLGTLSWSLTMVKSGWVYPYGMGFWGPNGHDGVWHIALIEALARGSRGMPVFSGEALKNYHIGFDLLVAIFHKLTAIPVVNLYFQIIPPILAFLVGILTYKFVLRWRDSKKEAFWAIFFVYFGGNLGWLVALVRNGKIGGESMFWSQQAVSTLINPPFALSLVFILLGLTFLLKYQKSVNIWYLVFSILCFGLLIEIKVYAGILATLALFFALLIRPLSSAVFKVFIGSAALSLVLFLLFNKGAASLVVFQPFWFLETMMGSGDRVNWQKFAEAMITYRQVGVWSKMVPAYLVAFIIFVAGNMGTRIISIKYYLLNIKNKFRNFGWVDVFINSLIAVGIVLPTLFLQKGTAWNTIQFFYYSLFFLAILAGIGLAELTGKTESKTLLICINIVTIFLTVPTTIGTLWYNYIPSRPPAKIGNEELSALKFLSQQPEGTVLTYPFDPIAAKNAESSPPRPLYLYESTAYVSAFSKKPTLLEDEVNLDITGYDWRERRKLVEEFYKSSDRKFALDFLKTNNIKYIFWLKGQRARFGEAQLGISRIFENEAVDIYKVD